MGCCFSNDEDKNQDQESERARLLNNPVSDGPTPQQVPSYGSGAPAPSQQKGDEQSALNRILHQTASDVIDVSAIDSHAMEQQEYMDRARQYSSRVSMAQVGHKFRVGQTLPAGVAAPHTVLSAPPVSQADIHLITSATEQLSKTLKEVKVKHKEDLVVPFGVP